MASRDVALLTDRRYVNPPAQGRTRYVQNILDEDALVSAGLARHGLRSRRVDWADPELAWESLAAAVFRTTWDYFDRLGSFLAWLDRVEGRVPLVNPAAQVRWNLDKHYLRELAAAGLRTVPTRFLEVGSEVSLASLLGELGWQEAVVKPAVSGAARHTYRTRAADASSLDPIIASLLRDEAMMVQPFLRDVVASGELALVVIAGRCTHAVRKVAKAGDFRVQDDHGGTVHPHTASREELEFAQRAVAACDPAPAYARVDLVRDDDGELALMELELIEPELFLRFHPPAAERLADELARRVEAFAG